MKVLSPEESIPSHRREGKVEWSIPLAGSTDQAENQKLTAALAKLSHSQSSHGLLLPQFFQSSHHTSALIDGSASKSSLKIILELTTLPLITTGHHCGSPI